MAVRRGQENEGMLAGPGSFLVHLRPTEPRTFVQVLNCI